MIEITEMTKTDTERVLNHLKKAYAIIERYENNGADYGTLVFNRGFDLEYMTAVLMTIERLFNDSYN